MLDCKTLSNPAICRSRPPPSDCVPIGPWFSLSLSLSLS